MPPVWEMKVVASDIDEDHVAAVLTEGYEPFGLGPAGHLFLKRPAFLMPGEHEFGVLLGTKVSTWTLVPVEENEVPDDS